MAEACVTPSSKTVVLVSDDQLPFCSTDIAIAAFWVEFDSASWQGAERSKFPPWTWWFHPLKVMIETSMLTSTSQDHGYAVSSHSIMEPSAVNSMESESLCWPSDHHQWMWYEVPVERLLVSQASSLTPASRVSGP